MPMLVKTKLIQTNFKGIGLFADEFIVKNQVIYKDDVNFDRIITQAEVQRMPALLRDFVKQNAGFSQKREEYYLCCDNARFWNHSNSPNTKYLAHEGIVISLINIRKGEELTADYREFCDYSKTGDMGFVIHEN